MDPSEKNEGKCNIEDHGCIRFRSVPSWAGGTPPAQRPPGQAQTNISPEYCTDTCTGVTSEQGGAVDEYLVDIVHKRSPSWSRVQGQRFSVTPPCIIGRI